MTARGLRRLWTDPETRRWLAFFALAATYALVSVYRLSTAVLADELTRAFDVTGTQLGTLHASFFYVYAAMQLPAGVFADRLGARRTVTGGTLVMSLGGIVFAAADSYALAFAGRALVGFGGSVLFIAILRFCANWFRPTEFARMSGFTLAVSGFGGVLATTPLALAVSAFGWRPTLTGMAAVGVGLATTAYLVARDTPSDAGFEPMAGPEPPGAPSLRAIVSNARTVLAERETWLCGAILFAGTGVNITVVGLWGIPYLVQTYGLSVTAASTYTLLGSAGLLVGPPTVGAVSDRLAGAADGTASTAARTRLIVIGMAIYTAAFATLAITGAPPRIVVAAVFFASGALAGAYALTYAVVKERHEAAASGVSTGTINTMAFTGAAILPTLMGYALDAYWTGETIGGARVYSEFGYQVAFGLAATVASLALLSSILLHRRTVARA
ncbi:MFS transporter [Natronomonas halophila]|uniref:MFS transporter n=1 Tax=Natronomonas halophila TaxID=2747817 RepID=UPI0015B742F5|nr:MFS transporter [Natronomonas halophila]QLD85850.1 MFS transporter [Natronomonas halophila]